MHDSSRYLLGNVLTTLLVLGFVANLICVSGCSRQFQEKSAAGIPMTLTGILLASDHNSWERILISENRGYYLKGDMSYLKQYERRRVAVTGYITATALIVNSVDCKEMPVAKIRALIEQLRTERWVGPENIMNPTLWVFNFTDPMLKILQAGPTAQEVLLKYLDDPQLKGRVIILLGGVGDSKAVEPIIRAMASPVEMRNSPDAVRINGLANLALTNITVSDVIWHHGGGMPHDNCPDDPKSCWYAWWIKNRNTFSVSATPSRNYSNYPNYGIYQQP